MKEKFLFCHDWYNTYRKSGLTQYDGIMDVIFTGSKISSNFIAVSVTYSDGERAWVRYEKNNPSSNISKFVNKMHSIVNSLPLLGVTPVTINNSKTQE